MGWKVNLWARALDGDHARKIIKNALKHSTSYGTDQYRGGIYYNLWDSHAPFQIDGNFGVCSGIAEMLMQSHTDTIQILPALASAWESGSITGLKAVGDFIVDINWNAGQLTTAKIVSNQGQPLVINYKGLAGKKVSINGEEVGYTIINADNIAVKAAAGDVVEIDYNAFSSNITALTTLPKGGKVYTLDGRMAHSPKVLSRGVYIADGKKMVVK
jgi:alpha-L-fucosidase 2